MIDLLYPTIFKDEWLSKFSSIFDTRWIGEGDIVLEFEKQFAKKFNYEYCLALNSGTSALELAYHLLNITNEDEVIISVLTCSATSIPAYRRGANVVFCDINQDLTMSADDLEKKISQRTKAVVAVTLGGLRLDSRINEIVKDYNVPLIIDAAQSVGVGETFGDYICYSFQAIKHFTTGDGGMLVTSNEEDYERSKKLRWFGIDREAKKNLNWQTLNDFGYSIDVEEAGYKYHMNNIAASMGLVGLNHTDEILEKRRTISETYSSKIITFNHVSGGSYWLHGLLVDNNLDFINKMRKKNIQVDVCHVRNDLLSIFGRKRLNLEVMNNLEDKYIYIPIHTNLSFSQICHIIESVNDYV